ncbi:hypothetical protein ACG7TL_002161 [Trametes sanguinea]
MFSRDADTEVDGLPASVVSSSKFFLRCLIVGCTLSAILYGITLQQAFLYYRRYARDNLPLKLFVAVLVILDTVATIFMIHGLDTYVVVDYLQPEKMTGLVWSLTAENCLCIITSVMVQCYFGQRLWILSRHNKIFTGLLFALAFVESGTGRCISELQSSNEGTIHDSQRDVYASFFVLILIGRSTDFDTQGSPSTSGLCYFLHTGKSGVKSSNSLIDKLMIYAVQRGIITLICQAYDFLTTLIAPTSFLFIPVALMQMKGTPLSFASLHPRLTAMPVYTNSLLATLNVRDSLTSSDTTIVELQSCNLVFAPSNHAQAARDTAVMRVRAPSHSRLSRTFDEKTESTVVRSSGSEVKVGALEDDVEGSLRFAEAV